MNAILAKEASPCCSRSVMLLADGELEPSRAMELELHMRACQGCRSQLELIKTMRASLRRSCARRAPGAFEERVRAKLCAVAVRSSTTSPSDGSTYAESYDRNLGDERLERSGAVVVGASVAAGHGEGRSRRWALAGAFAVAACFVVIVVMKNQPGNALHASRVSASSDAMSNFDALLDELVAQHANPLPPEERNPDELTRLEPYVGVPVKRPALTLLRNPQAASASFDGARIHRVREARNAAALQYKLKGHRVTVYVFDSRTIQLTRTNLRPKLVHRASSQPSPSNGGESLADRRSVDVPVYVGNLRGFSVAAAERAGVGYALASDLDEDNSVAMVSSF